MHRHPTMPWRIRALLVGVLGLAFAILMIAASPGSGEPASKPGTPAGNGRGLWPSTTTGSPTLQPGRPAPIGPKRLPTAPVRVPRPQPATGPVITGLAANGIPNVALNAYRRAAARMASVSPGCGIHWSLLAGIGRVESDHGRFAGATLNSDGTSTPRVIGIALDGTRSAYIGDSEGGAVDGDPVYDRAVGPMQFIPTTWASYGADGNGDGRVDPFNVNDAALASARYLCASGGNLRSQEGRVKAVLTYNYSNEYLNQVLALADAYASGVKVDGVPISGPTKGALPPVQPGQVPPANPAGPLKPATPSKPAATKATPVPSNSTVPQGTPGVPAKTASTTAPRPAPVTSTTPPPVKATVAPLPSAVGGVVTKVTCALPLPILCPKTEG